MGTEPGHPTDGDHGGTAATTPVQPPVFTNGTDKPPESLVAGTMGDRCVNCGAPLTPDQRYCVNCGERRGAARFTLPAATSSAASPEPVKGAPERGPRPRRVRPSSGATLVAGVGTLLLAMGVGVLIGHGTGSNTKSQAQPRAQVITVNAGGGGSATPSSDSGNTAPASNGSGSSHKSKSGSSSKHKSSGGSAKHKSSGGGHKTKSSAPPPAKPTKKEVQAASNAAQKVTGGSNVNNAPATVTVGGSCDGEGCDPKTHKFNGNFFGQ